MQKKKKNKTDEINQKSAKKGKNNDIMKIILLLSPKLNKIMNPRT